MLATQRLSQKQMRQRYVARLLGSLLVSVAVWFFHQLGLLNPVEGMLYDTALRLSVESGIDPGGG